MVQAIRAMRILAISTAVAGSAHAADSLDTWVARMLSLEGQVEAQRAAQRLWQPAQVGENYLQGDQVHTAAASRARLQFRAENYLSLDQNSYLTVREKTDAKGVSWLNLRSGRLRFRSHDPSDVGVNTPFVNALHRGTEFQVEVKDDQTVITVYDGTVEAKNDLGSLSVGKGQSAIARKGEAPHLYTVVKPEDAVQWSLFYPPVIDFSQPAPAGEPSEVKRALSLYRRNQLLEALAALDAVPADQRTSRYLNLRAGLLLTVGRVEQARPDIQEALRRDPKDATALAQQAVVAVASNDKNTALKLAEQAVAAQPKSSAAKLALSYALQSHFRLEEAREAMRTAHQDDPRNALVLTRLAELELSLADMDKGQQAAAEALSINPKQARAKALLGFAKLMNMDTDEAIETFEAAVKDDDADPLARFGFGLAKIRKGDLDEGTQEIETAASISPDDPLIRSYLGKAYYEQKRSGPAEAEYEIAKKLDPKDPTPEFYGALFERARNNPIASLQKVQQSIELNNNRAVYRSRFLLDDDMAARQANLARTYDLLGFKEAARVEAWKSVSTDSSNFSAHRFLAESYGTLDNQRAARVSELLKSQLLQPLSLSPVSPVLSEADLAQLQSSGPSEPSFNEFNPLFAENKFRFQGNFSGGTKDTFGDEVVVSGVKDRLSGSLGQYHYSTNGFRKNNGLTNDIYEGFGQISINSSLSFLGDIRWSRQSSGDLGDPIFIFSPDGYDPEHRVVINQFTQRFGFRFAPTQDQRLIGVYSNTQLNISKNTSLVGSVSQAATSQDVQVQYLANFGYLNPIIGFGYLNGSMALDFGSDPSPASPQRYTEGYGYLPIRINTFGTITFGVSAAAYENGLVKKGSVNPKFGLLLTPNDQTTIRFAAFRSLKRQYWARETIEPTEIAGFNQVFDDLNGTHATRYGVGIDHKFTRYIFAGVEASRRSANFIEANAKVSESSYKAYTNFIFNDHMALSAKYNFNEYTTPDADHLTGISRLSTHQVPVTLSIFHESGFFSKLAMTYVNQSRRFFVSTSDEDFFVLDATVGLRLPDRMGIISLEGKNLGDERFRYVPNLTPDEPFLPMFSSGRLIIGKLNLFF